MSVKTLTRSAINCLFDANLTDIPLSYLQSGIGYGDDLKVKEVIVANDDRLHWQPIVNPGYYYIGREEFRLYSRQSYVTIPRSSSQSINLPLYPLESSKITLIRYHRDSLGRSHDSLRYRQKPRFTGTIIQSSAEAMEQVNLDNNGDVVNYNLLYANTVKNEFVLVRNKSFQTTMAITSDILQDVNGLYIIPLNPAAIVDLPVIFSNKLLFQTKVDSIPQAAGEWLLSPDGSYLAVYYPDYPCALGHVRYCHSYPAQVILAKSYIEAHGSIVEENQRGNCNIIGRASGLPNQLLFSTYFPIYSTDTTTLLVFNDAYNTIETWTLGDLADAGPEDQVYQLDIDKGVITFGDGVNGAIPTEGSEVGLVYSSLPFLRYEVNESEVVTEELNLNPVYSPNSYGYIYLARHVNNIQSLTLSCDLATSQFTDVYGPIYCGSGFAKLGCLVESISSDALDNVKIEFIVDATTGFEQSFISGNSITVITGSDGMARTIMAAPRNVMDLAKVVELYNSEDIYLNPYDTIDIVNDSLNVGSRLCADSLYSEVYTFLLVDADPAAPYSRLARKGGTMVLLYVYDEATMNFIPLRPIANDNAALLTFPSALPRPVDYSQIRKFVIVAPKVVDVYCQTTDPSTGVTIRSNTISILVKASAYQMGDFSLQSNINTSSTLNSASYITIDRRGQLRSSFTIDSAAPLFIRGWLQYPFFDGWFNPSS